MYAAKQDQLLTFVVRKQLMDRGIPVPPSKNSDPRSKSWIEHKGSSIPTSAQLTDPLN